MKILIVYDSLYGNTEKIARSISEVYSEQQVRLMPVKDVSASDLTAVNLFIAGSPTHGGRPSQGVKDFLNGLPAGSLKNIQAAAFDTGIPVEVKKGFVRFIIRFFGYASKHIAKVLKKNGAAVLAAETFFVLDKEGPLKEGEIERSKKWAGDLLKK